MLIHQWNLVPGGDEDCPDWEKRAICIKYGVEFGKPALPVREGGDSGNVNARVIANIEATWLANDTRISPDDGFLQDTILNKRPGFNDRIAHDRPLDHTLRTDGGVGADHGF